MKKLLSLLIVLTISGTAVPTTIAASPYQKEKTKLENINILQSNSSGNLIRNKRQRNNVFTTQSLNFDNNVKEYFKNLCKVVKNLLDQNIIVNVSDRLENQQNVCDVNYFSINPNSNYNYFIVPLILEGRDIQLVFRSSDFYLQGFTIVNNADVPLSLYFHFNDSEIKEVQGYASRDMGFLGNYGILMGHNSREVSINWSNIIVAFQEIINYGDRPNYRGNTSVIRGALARVILATSESMRFRIVRNSIINSDQIQTIWGFYHDIIKNWNSLTKEAIEYIIKYGTLNGFSGAAAILMFSSDNV